MNVFGRALPRAGRRLATLVSLTLVAGLGLSAAPAYADLGNQQIYIGGIVANCSDCTTSGSGMPYTRGGTSKTEPTLNASVSTSSNGTTIDGTSGAVFFCVDMNNPIGVGTPIQNVSQAQAFNNLNNPSSVVFPNKLKWTLANGATGLNTTDFAAKLTSAGVTFNSGLTRDEAIFGTQWAIWHFSEGDITLQYANSGLTNTGKDVFAVAKYLIDNADGAFTEPAVSLTAPATTTGAPGDVLGPWTVNHNALGNVGLSASNGATLQSSASGGSLAASVAPGTQFWVKLPATTSGSTTITATAASAQLQYVQASSDPNTKQKGAYTWPTTLTGTSGANWATAPAKVGDFVWEDLNGDGIQQSGEPGISGVKLSLAKSGGGAFTDLDNNPVGQATTDGNGKYEFGNLKAGTYVVSIASGVPSAMVATVAGAGSDTTKDSSTGSATSGALTAGQSDLSLDFGYYKPVKVGDRVWLDSNGDGVQDSGEAGYPGATVTLTKPGGATLGQVTGSNGSYLFDNLPPGGYTVTLTVPSGYSATTATAMSSGTLASGGSNLTLDFGIKPIPPAPATVGDFVWQDLNADGIQQPGEPGIAGVKLSITKAGGGSVTDLDNNTVGQATTDANGAYTFTNLPAGSYVVTIASGVPSGMVATVAGAGSDTTKDSSTGSANSAALAAGDTDSSLDFGYYTPVKVGDRVWLDSDGDGVQDSGENGITGITVTLTKPGGATVTQVTGTNGAYLFNNLPPGAYSVTVSSYAGHNATTPTTQSSGTLTSGQSDLTLDFGFRPKPVKVGDFVWIDTDEDGIQDLGEPGVEGATMTLTKASGGSVTDLDGNVVGPVSTDSNGAYLFTNLPAGSYKVGIDTSTAPALVGKVPTAAGAGSDPAKDSSTGTATSAALTPGDSDLTLDFGFKDAPVLPVSVGDRVWLDTDGDGIQDNSENGITGVTVTLTKPGGGTETQTTGVDGAYLFANLPPGSYSVTVTSPGGGYVATTATTQSSGALAGGDSNLNLDFGFRAPPGSDLSLDKSVDKAVAGPGETLTYTLKARNDGSGDATDVVITDTLPSGVTYQSSSPACTYSGGTVTCALGTVAAHSSTTVTITVKVNALPGGNTSHQHQFDYTKVESHVSAFAGDTSGTTQCPSGYVATDGSVRLDNVDQGAGTFADVEVLQSAVTPDGRGWTGTVRNHTTGQVQAKVEVVCASQSTVSGENHTHPLDITGPVATTQTFGPGRHDVDLTCAADSWAIDPSYVVTDGSAVVTTRRTSQTDWRFIVDVPTSATGTFAVRCLSTHLGVANGHSHDLVFQELSDSVEVPAGGTVERKLTCADGYKGIVAWADLPKGLISLGNDPQPITRVFKFYNSSNTALTGHYGLLCVAIRTAGSGPGDQHVTNTGHVTTTSNDASTADDTDSASTTVSATGVTASPRAAVLHSSKRTAVKVSLASSHKRRVNVRLVNLSRAGGIKKGAVLASTRAKLRSGDGVIRLTASGKAGKVLRAGKVRKATLVIRSGGHTSSRVIRLR